MRFAITLIAGVLAACAAKGPAPQRELHIGAEFTGDERAVILESALAWHEPFALTSEDVLRPWRVLVHRAECKPGTDGGAFIGPGGVTICIQPWVDGPRLRQVATHEYGHALGLGHRADGVMNPGSVTADVTADDREALHRCWASGARSVDAPECCDLCR